MTVAWVTGARGFIGRHLSQRLAREGMLVGGVGYGSWLPQEAAHWGIGQWVDGAVDQPGFDRLERLTGLPDLVFHLAGGSAVGRSIECPLDDFSRTVNSTAELLEWARVHASGASLVFASSAAVYGAGYSRPIRESDPVDPYSPYGAHKRMAEELFQSYATNFGLRTAVVRLFSVYGNELRKQLLWDICGRYRDRPEEITMAGSGREMRDWLHVDDAVSYLLAAAQAAGKHCVIVNGGTGFGKTVNQVASAVRDCWGLDTKINFSGHARAGDPRYLVADAQLSGSLGIEPEVLFESGIKEYVAWYRRHISGDSA